MVLAGIYERSNLYKEEVFMNVYVGLCLLFTNTTQSDIYSAT